MNYKDILENKGGFISAHWDGTPETEELIKQETKALYSIVLPKTTPFLVNARRTLQYSF